MFPVSLNAQLLKAGRRQQAVKASAFCMQQKSSCIQEQCRRISAFMKQSAPASHGRVLKNLDAKLRVAAVNTNTVALVPPAPTLKAKAVRRLEEDIVAGRFEPGSRLDEVQLAERYELSRTPLREAFAELAASGLIEIRPRSGAFVAQVSSRSMLECLAFTAEIEGIAAGWAAIRMTVQERRALQAVQAAAIPFVEASDADGYFDVNRQFHEAVYAGAHNNFVQECAHKLFLRGSPFRRLQLRQRGRLVSSHAEHGRIIEAILAEDSSAAASAVRAHVMIQGDRFMEFLATVPKAYIGPDSA